MVTGCGCCGQRQRAMIAVALSADPAVLLCDEPTTALDVTIAAQILAMLGELRETRGLGLVFVTHDLGIVGQICDDIAVMYAGRMVETGPVGAVLDAPRHPYTAALRASAIDLDSARQVPRAIPGTVPDPLRLPTGCPRRRSTGCPASSPAVSGSGSPSPGRSPWNPGC
jgi:oligopeptide/dipeptide ABC transporter ATP-binding protein